jgi:hypothetical protein
LTATILAHRCREGAIHPNRSEALTIAATTADRRRLLFQHQLVHDDLQSLHAWLAKPKVIT